MEEQQRNTLGMVSSNTMLILSMIVITPVARKHPTHRMEEQQRNTVGSNYTDECKHGNTIVHRVASQDPAQRYEEQQWDLQHHRDTRSDPEARAAIK